jgi:galactan endo-1,6-beta-galactosidase
MPQVNVHGYQQGGDRASLYNAVVAQGGKVLRDSEYGDGDGSGATLAASLFADWSALHPTGWCYWQLLDVSPGWGLLQMDANAGAPGVVNTKYYVVAQFSRHIRPGSVVLSTAAADPRNSTAAAWDSSSGVLTLVTSNPKSSAVNVTFDLSGFGTVPPGPVAGQWMTNMTSAVPWASAAYAQVSGAVVTSESQLVLLLPALFITTVEVAGVQL